MKKSSFVWRVGLVRRDVSGVSSRCRVFGAGEVRLKRVVFGGTLVTTPSGVYFSAVRDIARKSGISERGLRLADL
jgi:hypothetical protein